MLLFKLTLQVPRELNVSVLRSVRAPSRAPFPEARVAAVVAVPIVAAPEILPVPPKVPALTCTGPVPVAEPVLFRNQQRAFGNGGAAGVGVSDFVESQFARPSLGERTARAAAESAILDQPGKGPAHVIRAHGQVNTSEEHQAAAFNRAGRYARSVVTG